MEELNLVVRWLHLLFGITWIGMLYYFNFVQGSYFKAASAEGLADAKAKLAPNALWWFRWGALFTFITGLILFSNFSKQLVVNDYILIGGLMGTLMFLNVWLVIWPAQKIALGIKEGDGPANAAKALLASRTNTLFSAPMAYCMVASAHGGYGREVFDLGTGIAILIIALLELNGLFGKQGPLASVVGVIHMSLALTLILVGCLRFL